MTASAKEHETENQKSHIPVLLKETVEALAPRNGDIIIDGTFGRGGYSRAIIAACPDCTVYGIDRDPEAVEVGKQMEREFPGRFHMLHGQFGSMDTLLCEAGVKGADGVALDIGVSSPQFDNPERGFSFRYDAPLDMRMSKSGISAADIVNDTPEDELADIIYLYGEEHASRKIAKNIVAARGEKRITRTGELADIVRKTIPKTGKTDQATKTFQALRIAVNDELGELERGLHAAENILKSGGRLAVVSFHSLEDRIVKQFMRKHSGETESFSRHTPSSLLASNSSDAPFSLPKKSSVKPSREEEENNPRSRSARLRVAIRTSSPSMPFSHITGEGE